MYALYTNIISTDMLVSIHLNIFKYELNEQYKAKFYDADMFE